MLTDMEKERLRTRGKLDPHTRNTNDLRVRRKLKVWLDDINDIELIFDFLPANQLNKVINKLSPIYLLSIALSMKYVNHRSIVGPLEFPDSWKVVDFNDWSTSTVEDIDIETSLNTLFLIQALAYTAGTTANLTDMLEFQNPIAEAIHLTGIPNIQNQLTEGEKRGIERINQARRRYGFGELGFRQLKPRSQSSPLPAGSNSSSRTEGTVQQEKKD